MGRVELVVLDVNETLSDMAPLRQRFVEVGAPAHLLDVWFAGTLRDGFALAVTGSAASFPDVGTGVLRALLTPLAQQSLKLSSVSARGDPTLLELRCPCGPS